jgi:para-nitrobenzyl esterase
VWIHGGGYTAGAGSDSSYNGENLVNKGLVTVTINYRLGPLGFLATSALSGESGRNSSGNYGLLDQMAALRWIQRNIAAFGGDPNKVTIGGQSAGTLQEMASFWCDTPNCGRPYPLPMERINKALSELFN